MDIFQDDLPPILQNAMTYTAFALDEFKRRTERDGASLLILSWSSAFSRSSSRMFDMRLKAMAEARVIPVIDQYDYIQSIGADPADARYRHDGHWNAQGHDWAAEALLQYLDRNPDLCRGG